MREFRPVKKQQNDKFAGPGIDRSVLVVQPDAHVYEQVLHVLREEGFRVYGAATGAEAIEAATKEEFVLFIAQDLPDMPGTTLVHTLKGIGRPMPFVALIENDAAGVAVDMMELGARQCVTRELAVTELVPALFRRLFQDLDAEAELSREKTRSRELFEHMSSGVAICAVTEDTNDFVFVDINRAGALIGKIAREEHIGRSVSALYPGFKILGLFDALKDVWKTGLPKHLPMCEYEDERISFWLESYICRLPSGEIVWIYDDVTGRERAARALKLSEERSSGIVNAIPDPMVMMDRNQTVTWQNNNAFRAFGNLVGKRCYHVFKSGCEDRCTSCAISKILCDGSVYEFEENITDIHGTPRRYWCTAGSALSDYYGRPTLVVATLHDVTEKYEAEKQRKELEQQYRQALKMESVGRLAGGVAHDLNNMLAPILGYAEVLLEDLANDGPHTEYVQHIVHAGIRARDLVRQLLAFSRKQTLEVKPIDVNEMLRNFEKLLKRTIREDISLQMKPAPSLPFIEGDVGQLEQVIMNLAVNAQDAMPDGGELVIETRSIVLDEACVVTREGVKPGDYVQVIVSDTGCGMDEDVLDNIFDPFFTTKGEDKGTGLGLATVYGIVKQHGGHIQVHSKTGGGAHFEVLLPASSKLPAVHAQRQGKEDELTGTETVLLVEDDEQVRNLTRSILEQKGYKVLAAGSGNEAISLAANHPQPLDLMITDVVMPHINGKQLFEEISRDHGKLKVLFMSGYTDDVIAHHGVMEPGVEFIQKPFSIQALGKKVREVLNC